MASTSTATTMASSASKKRSRPRPSRAEIEQMLSRLEGMPRPLPSDLPPSPPASRSASPQPPSNKRRRIDESVASSSSSHKKPNVTPPNMAHPLPTKPVVATWGSPVPHNSSLAAASSSQAGPSTVKQERRSATPSSVSGAPSPAHKARSPPHRKAVVYPAPPASRPWTRDQMTKVYTEVYESSRKIKRSSEARLNNKPPPIGRIKLIGLCEATEALVQYVYAFWVDDETKGRIMAPAWNSIMGLLYSVRKQWQSHGSSSDRHKAMLGLIALIEGTIISRISSATFADLARRQQQDSSSSAAGPANALSPAASSAGGHHPSPSSGHGHSGSGSHLAPPSPLHPHASRSHPGGAAGANGGGGGSHHPTPPSMMISPEPSPQASGTSASMHSSPSPPNPLHGGAHGGHGHGGHAMHPNANGVAGAHQKIQSPNPGRPGAVPVSTTELWDALRSAQHGTKRMQEASSSLTPAVLRRLYPVTWARCQAGAGVTHDGLYYVGVNEAWSIDLAACGRMPVPVAEGSTVAGSSAASSSSAASTKAEEQEEGEAEDGEVPASAVPVSAPMSVSGSSSSGSGKDQELVDHYHEGARWAWPFTASGENVAHVAAFGKSLLYELARAELEQGGGAPYRGAAGASQNY